MNDLELVRRFREDVPELSPAEIQASRAALMERLSRPSPPPPSRDRVWVWRRVSVGATIAAAVALAVVLPMVLPGGGPGGAEPAAAAALQRAAGVAAASQPGGTPAAGEYVYTKSRSVYLSGFNAAGTDRPGGWALVPFEREVWIGRTALAGSCRPQVRPRSSRSRTAKRGSRRGRRTSGTTWTRPTAPGSSTSWIWRTSPLIPRSS